MDADSDIVVRLESARYALELAEQLARTLSDARLTAQLTGLRLIVEDLVDTIRARMVRRP